MHIIDTIKNFSRPLLNLRRGPALAGNSLIVVLTFVFLPLPFLPGCSKAKQASPQEYAMESRVYYQRAVDAYKKLITEDKNRDKLIFELGKLYFDHGDFSKAAQEFEKTNSMQAKKYLAIAYYRMGKFTQALDIFDKSSSLDDEGRFYYGLTAEKLNLFDQALDNYKKIKEKSFYSTAQERINIIEKQANLLNIKKLSPQIYKLIAEAPTQKEYPQAGALILLADENVLITSDGRQISEIHYLIKILNERGKENFSESQISYDSTYERIELEFARTIKPDGSVLDVGSRHIRDVSKYLNFPLYSNAHVYIISFPEITEGAIIEYKLKITRNQLINKKDFVLSYPVQASEPIINADFKVRLPNEKKLHIKLINAKYNDFGAQLNPQISRESEEVVYAWSFKDIPQILPESHMPAEVEVNPTLLLSTFKNWQDIYNWWLELSKEKIKADPAIKEKVKGLIANQASEEEKIKKIYNFCAQEIRYVAVEYGQAGFEPHNAADTFKNKYGDCKDKAILLVAMLRGAGFSAWPVLISTKEYYNLNEDFPTVLFNHCIAAISLGGKTVFMDPTAQTCAFGDLPADDQNRKVLVFGPEEYRIETTLLYPASHNLTIQDFKIKINSDEGILAQKRVFTGGVYDQMQRYWLLYTPPELIADTLREKIQEISIGSKLLKYDIKNLNNLSQPVELDFSFSGPEYLTAAGFLRILPQLAGLDTSLVAKDKRRYAIDFGIMDEKETIFEVRIPDNFTVKYIPETVSEDSPWLKFSAQYNQRQNTVYCRQQVELKKNVVTETEYADFKAFFEGLAKKIKQRVVLERVK